MNHKCIWMKSNIHINHVNLFWLYLFMKSKYEYLKLKNWLNRNENFWTCVCIYLSNSKLFYPYTRSKLNKPRYKSSSPSRLDPNTIQELDSSWVLDAILKHKLLNQHVIASKFDFESFVEAKHLLRSWSNIWD